MTKATGTNPTVDIEKTVALREAEASRNELEQRVARAMLNCAAWSSFWSEDDALVLARAALKAHAEWLENRMETMCSAANDARLADPEEAEGIFRTMLAAAQQEDQHHD